MTLHLIWTITLPERMPIIILYDSTSTLFLVDHLHPSVSSILTKRRTGEYIQSVVILTLIKDINLTGSMVECSITNLDSESTVVDVNSAGNRIFFSNVL